MKDEKKIILDVDSVELNASWLRAYRLLKKAKKGDKQARKELDRMDNTEMVTLDRLMKTFKK